MTDIIGNLIAAGFSLGILMMFIMGDTIKAKLHDFYGSVINGVKRQS